MRTSSPLARRFSQLPPATTQPNLYSENQRESASNVMATAEKQLIRNGNLNKVRAEDASIHDWYRFVLSFPPHLVRDYLQKFGIDEKKTVLDPFCGTGTTLVECNKLGIESVGIEAN